MPELFEYATGNYIPLSDQFLIGRSLECSYVIEDIAISRKHCKITTINDKWFVTDLSANGILVNDRKLQSQSPTELNHNDSIEFSTHLFGFKSYRDAGDVSYANIEVIDLDDQNIVNDSVILQFHNNATPVKTPGDGMVLPAQPPPQQPQPAAVVHTESNFEDELTCSICTELFINAMALNCQHVFCELCIQVWKRNNRNCPICRKGIASQTPSITINNLVSLVVAQKSAEEKAARKTVVDERTTQYNNAIARPSATAQPSTSRTPRGRGAAALLPRRSTRNARAATPTPQRSRQTGRGRARSTATAAAIAAAAATVATTSIPPEVIYVSSSDFSFDDSDSDVEVFRTVGMDVIRHFTDLLATRW